MKLLNIEISETDGKCWIDVNGRFINSIGKFSELKEAKINSNEFEIQFDNAIAFPGLINSHDHLEFNLFPMLGNKKYNDYVEWGVDIHKSNSKTITEILKIPIDLRIKYGIYKNILNGVTTVINHGKNNIEGDSIIDVITKYNYLHSIRLEKYWRAKINLVQNNFPFVIHIGEGTNRESYDEINKLIQWNIFNKKIIGVHAIAMDVKQAEHFKAIVWCPVSNNFLYGKTSHINSLKYKTEILFGTDSNLSSEWNLWKHLRFARNFQLLNDTELFQSVTSNASKVWGINKIGSINTENIADIVAAEKNSSNFFDSFYSLNPNDILLIIKKGKIIFFDEKILNQLKDFETEIPHYTKIKINESIKYILGRLDELCDKIKFYTSEVSFPFEYFR